MHIIEFIVILVLCIYICSKNDEIYTTLESNISEAIFMQ